MGVATVANASTLPTLQLLERLITLQAPPVADAVFVAAALCATAASPSSLAAASAAVSTLHALLVAEKSPSLPESVLRVVHVTALKCAAAHGRGRAADVAARVALTARQRLAPGHPFHARPDDGASGPASDAAASGGGGSSAADATALERRVHSAARSLFAPLVSTRWQAWLDACHDDGGEPVLAAWLSSLIVRADLTETELEALPGVKSVPAWARDRGVGGPSDTAIDTVWSTAVICQGERRRVLELVAIVSCVTHPSLPVRAVQCRSCCCCYTHLHGGASCRCMCA